ncbi:MAG: hypothetical protein GC164_08095 [Phycisphaera sp.]|nr:hypothetical protein [Phycisphaera sp.]
MKGRRLISIPPVVWSLACAVVLGLSTVAWAQGTGDAVETFPKTTYWLPPAVSESARQVDTLFDGVLILTTVVCVGVFVLLLLFAFRYRFQADRRATFIHGNNKLETVWTLIPAFILVGITSLSQSTWSSIKTPFTPPSTKQVQDGEVAELRVVGRQFKWYFQYPGKDGKLGPIDPNIVKASGSPEEQIGLDRSNPDAKDDFVSVQMVVPVHRMIYIHLQSVDVLHSFYLPDFRIKQDAVPGLIGKVWLKSDKTSGQVMGVAPDSPLQSIDNATFQFVTISEAKPFDIVCAELCGQGHYTMRGAMYVVTDEEYRKFLDIEEKNVTPQTGTDTQTDDAGY